MLEWIEQHPSLAGWLQAIGTIVALLVAVGLPAMQRSGHEHANAIQTRFLLEEALDLAFWAVWFVRRRATMTDSTPGQLAERFTALLGRLDQIQPANFSVRSATSIAEIRQDLFYLERVARNLNVPDEDTRRQQAMTFSGDIVLETRSMCRHYYSLRVPLQFCLDRLRDELRDWRRDGDIETPPDAEEAVEAAQEEA